MDIDEKIRSLLRSTPHEGPVIEPAFDWVERRGRARRRNRRFMAAAVGALVLAGIAVPLGLLSTLGRQSPSGPVGPPATLRLQLANVLRVQRGLVDVDVEGGTIWVAGGGPLTRVDVSTNRFIARLKLAGVEDFSRLATGESSLWVTADGGKVYRIDPATNRVVATLRVGGNVQGIAVGGGSVWVTQVSGATGALLRIDPTTDRLVNVIRVAASPIEATYGFGSVWVTSTQPPSVTRVDSGTGRTWTVPISGPLSIGFGSVWAVEEGSVVRFDPAAGRVLARIPIPRAAETAVENGRVWVLAEPKSSSPNLFEPIRDTARIWQIDPASNTPIGTPVTVNGLQPTAIAAAGGSVWVGDYDSGNLYRFDVTACHGPCAAVGPSVGVGPCQASQLRLSVAGSEQYVLHSLRIYGLQNTGTTPCSMKGYPHLTVIRSGKPIPINLRYATNSPVYQHATIRKVILQPGETGSFYLAFLADPNGPPCASPPADRPNDTLEVTPPGARQPLIDAHQGFCPGYPIPLYVSPVQPGVTPP